MASATTTEQRVSFIVDGEADEQQQQRQHDDDLVSRAAVVAREVSKRVSRLSVEGGGDAQGVYKVGSEGGVARPRNGHPHEADAGEGTPRFRRSSGGARALPPPHAWLAIEDTRKLQEEQGHDDGDDPHAEQWARLFRGGGTTQQQQQRLRLRRSSFSMVRRERERAAREAWLDHAWEMKRSWHQRNGGAPDAGTPVVVVVGTSSSSSSHSDHQATAAGGGVAMDVEEVRACRDLGLELPSDCTVEIQCYGLSGGSSPTHGSGADSPCAGSSRPVGGTYDRVLELAYLLPSLLIVYSKTETC
ncbi:Os05g0140333-like protein [Zea mays]|jgi:hypothetical protein|uniref:Os05g0140333-like protein n=1 Tax=Zea mays TaxID=4577 RepID=A0A1D6J1T9_MAIZE|nr:Os05g0140333-like protein [Zea mays]